MSGGSAEPDRLLRPWVPLGSSALRVPRLGIGTVPLGDMIGPVSDDDAERTVRAAHALGASMFDTAPQYGLGLAERRLGRVLPSLDRDGFVVVSKVGRLLRPVSSVAKLRATVSDAWHRGPAGASRLGRNTIRGAKRLLRRPTTARLGYPLERGDDALDAVFDFSYDGALRSVEESLARLKLDRLDAVLIHDPDEHIDEALAGSYRALREMREQGVIGAVGIGTNRVAPLIRLAAEADFDCFLLAGRYTLLDHGSLDELFAACTDHAVSLVIGGVFNSGMLVDPRPGQLFDYQQQRPGSPWLERAQRIKAACERHGVPLPAAALQFPIGNPLVACVLTGVRSAQEIEQNVKLFNWPIPAELWDELRREELVAPHVPLPAGAAA